MESMLKSWMGRLLVVMLIALVFLFVLVAQLRVAVQENTKYTEGLKDVGFGNRAVACAVLADNLDPLTYANYQSCQEPGVVVHLPKAPGQ